MISAIIPAAGSSRRMQSTINKQFIPIAGQPVLTRSLLSLADFVDEFIIVSRRGEEELCRECARYIKNTIVITGGTTRQESVHNGLKLCQGEYVMVHDGNRPLAGPDLVRRVLAAAKLNGAAIPAVPVVDTIKEVQAGQVRTTLPRQLLYAVQTPQIFRRDLLLAAYQNAQGNKIESTDDSSLVEAMGMPVAVVEGERTNLKITTPDDILRVEEIIRDREGMALDKSVFTGIGYDVHQLVPHRNLVLGGVKIPHPMGLLGHSDADVLVHAIMDAMLGAAGLGDIGRHFPDTDPAWAGADSCKLLVHVNQLLAAQGLDLVNIDAVVIAQEPKLSPYISQMRQNIAKVTGLNPARVNIKATTTEGLGFAGRQEGIAAQAVCTVTANRDRR